MLTIILRAELLLGLGPDIVGTIIMGQPPLQHNRPPPTPWGVVRILGFCFSPLFNIYAKL